MQEDKPKDNLLNIIFALTIKDDSDEEQYLKLDDIEDLISKLVAVGEKYPYIHEYDLPDLSPENIKKNRHVDYIGLDKEVAYHMGLKESRRILKRNENLVNLISNFAAAESFSGDVMEFTNNTVIFDCHNPNIEYELGFVNNGQEKKENKLLTDGKINIIEQTENYKKVKIEDATYTIQAAYEDDRLKAAIVKTHFVHPSFLTFLMFEVRDFYKEQFGSYEESEKPSVLRKRLN